MITARPSGHNNVRDSTQWVYLPTTGGGRNNPYEATAKNQLLDFYLNYSKDLKALRSRVEVMGGYSWAHFYSSGSDSTMNEEKRRDHTRKHLPYGELPAVVLRAVELYL